MPEIKNTFLQGKMNKDIDERLMPAGQYRDAMNIEVSTSEGSNVGTVKSILGNKRVDVTSTFNGVPSGFECIGSIANEKSNKIYWFITSHQIDAILEYDTTIDEAVPVIVDVYGGESNAVLKFTGSIITGINIIDNLLFWTDNQGEPKKINIDKCKKGTPIDALNDINNPKHTQLIFEVGSFHGITLEQVAQNAINDFDVNGSTREFGEYFWFQEEHIMNILPPGVFYVGGSYNIRHYRDGKYLGTREIQLIDNTNGYHARLTGPGYGTSGDASLLKQWYKNDVIFADNFTVDIQERHITVIKPKPLNALSVKINHKDNSNTKSNIPNLFETKFPRFSYRYKYRDGEFSPMAPFTQPVFNPKYAKDTDSGIDILSTKDDAYNVKSPYNKAMVNSIHSIELTDFISLRTPEDAVEIDILYKREDSPVIYSIDTIRHIDPEWHAWSNNEDYNIGVGKDNDNDYNHSGYKAHGGNLKGKYIVTTENIYAALPANQLLRPWDAVPRKALAQDVTGNRIVYGNYLQNYNLGPGKVNISVDYSNRNNKIGSFETQGLPSVKSKRNYQVGVVYADKYGRETPVFTSKSGAVNIPWADKNDIKNASKSNQINASVPTNFPEWVDSIKFFIKQNSREYYNLVMDRAWPFEKTYALDNSEGHLWISFPSSDRNKVTEEDYIILKKKIGVGEQQVSFENKFKILDIQNEAPDAVKYELINLGTAKNNASNVFTTGADHMFPIAAFRPDKHVNSIIIDHSGWEGVNTAGVMRPKFFTVTLSTPTVEEWEIPKNLYISWRRETSSGQTLSSKKYRIKAAKFTTSNYNITLEKEISIEDADIAHKNGDSSGAAQTHLHQDLVIQVERKDLIEGEDFSGKFFVKISENQVTDLITEGETTDILDNYMISARQKSWYWEDDKGTTAILDDNTYGITNAHYIERHGVGTHNVKNAANNNNVGMARPGGSTVPANAFVTDWYAPWDGLLAQQGSGQWFIDAVYLTAGQSAQSNLAKYCYFPLAGAHKNEPESEITGSSWSYPPFKVWWSEFKQSATMLESLASDASNQNWYDENLISEVGGGLGIENEDWNGLKIDGWVGALQGVERKNPLYPSKNHVNGLEGWVTTENTHVTGPRRWFSGPTGNPSEYGNGVDTKTYSHSEETGKYYIHLSYFAPGDDLHNNIWDEYDGTDAENDALYGLNAISRKLQGVWGGGHFTGDSGSATYGAETDKWQHIPLETNNDATDYFPLEEAPGPGVGYGYDINYQEQHERQWDPTYGPGNEDADGSKARFINNLVPGSRFTFANENTDTPTVFTIKNVKVKKIYNHTSWRDVHNIYTNSTYFDTGLHWAYKSVEQTGMEWLNVLKENQTVASNGDFSGNPSNEEQKLIDFRNKIVDFGKRSNRRICYIIEIDKDKDAINVFDPLDTNAAGHDDMTGDTAADEKVFIQFLEKVQSVLLSDLNKFSAIWETDPKKLDADLDIYYEASGNIPVKINSENNELFAPLGCKVEILDASTSSPYSYLKKWDDNKATFHPGFPLGDDIDETNYSGVSFKFIRKDGSFTIAEASTQQLIGNNSSTTMKTEFEFKQNIGDNIRVGLGWHNCFSFGNGIESNRIRDDFNEIFITNGVKASTITQQTYEEERRSHGLIFSGLYNSNSGVNDLNQFIMAEKITKDLNPTYGSIQKLFSRDSDLITLCEDKVVKVLANKDAVFNADGNPQLTANMNVLGQAIPFVGDYGISKNPESFASESYRAYFTDKQRGAVLRLSRDGLTPISKAGMHDWFRDHLPKYPALIGSFDAYKEQYNVTLSKRYSENIIYNTFLQEGEGTETLIGSILDIITNGSIYAGNNLRYSYQEHNMLTSSLFTWKPGDPGFINGELLEDISVTNHAAIYKGQLQPEVTGQVNIDPSYITVSGVDPGTNLPYEDVLGAGASVATTTTQYNVAQGTLVDFQYALYNYAGGLPDSGSGMGGQVYDGFYQNVTDDLFGGQSYYTASSDPNIHSRIYRTSSGSAVSKFTPGNHADIGSFTAGGTLSQQYYGSPWTFTGVTYDSTTEYPHVWPRTYNGSACLTGMPSGTISRDSTTGFIIFDGCADRTYYSTYNFDNGFYNEPSVNRLSTLSGATPAADYNTSVYNPDDFYVHIKSIGTSAGLPSQRGEVNDEYYNNGGGPNEGHNAMYSGDELHVVVELECYPTAYPHTDYGTPFTGDVNPWGYNHIAPKIELLDNTTPLTSDHFVLQPVAAPGNGVYNTGDNPYEARFSNLETSISYHSDMSYSSTPVHTGGTDYYVRKGYQANPYVSFTSTSAKDYNNNLYIPHSTIPGHLWDNDYNTINAQNDGFTPFTYRVGASWKFKSPTLQNDDGSPVNPPGGPYGEQILIEEAVVNDLTIKISQTQLPYQGELGTGIGNFYDSKWGYIGHNSRQVWKIKSVTAVKGFGIAHPYTAYAPETYADETTTTWSNVQIYDPNQPLPQALIEAVKPVPPFHVPAWTEKISHGLNGWTITNSATGGYNSGNLNTFYGNNYHAVTQYGNQANSDASLPPTPNAIEYVVPKNWGYGTSDDSDLNNNATSTDPNIPVNGTPFYHAIIDENGNVIGGNNQNSSPASDGNDFNRSGASHNNYSPALITHDNDYRTIVATAQAGTFSMDFDITDEPWQEGKWYLVDVEFTDVTNITPQITNSLTAGTAMDSSGDEGSVFIYSVIDHNTNVGWGNTYDSDGIGRVRGGSGAHVLQLMPVTRKEYGASPWSGTNPGDNKQVLRAVFKVHPNSNAANNNAHATTLRLRFFDFEDRAALKSIVCKRLWEKDTKGTADSWILPSSGNQSSILHSFTPRTVYYDGTKLCVDTDQNWHIYQGWGQSVSNNYPIATQPSPKISPSGWKLKFNVSQLPGTAANSFQSGSGLKIRIASDYGENGASTSEYCYAQVNKIEHTGYYEFFFNMDGNSNMLVDMPDGTQKPWHIKRSTDNGVTWVDYSSGMASSNQATYLYHKNLILLVPNTTNTNLPVSLAINNITLTDETIVFESGSIANWTIRGFDDTVDTYIQWTQTDNGRIEFNDMPFVDPASNLAKKDPISVGQNIDVEIKKGEKYRVEFNYSIESAHLKFYYYNSAGEGFFYEGQDPFLYVAAGDNPIVNQKFDKVFEIGQTTWSNINPSGNQYTAHLKNSIVFLKSHGSLPLVGSIDNIKMTRYYDDDELPQKTVSFSEDVNGWTSFKSFIPESAASVSKKYYTINDGALYQHYFPMKNGDPNNILPEEADNYNSFYNDIIQSENSSITTVFNADPSIVKIFNTINYEGDQARILKPGSEFLVNTNNALAWYQNQDIDGWYCEHVTTNLSSGTVREFIKKEGKWFNYIQGQSLSTDTIDTSRFSVQGLGVVESIEIIS